MPSSISPPKPPHASWCLSMSTTPCARETGKGFRELLLGKINVLRSSLLHAAGSYVRNSETRSESLFENIGSCGRPFPILSFHAGFKAEAKRVAFTNRTTHPESGRTFFTSVLGLWVLRVTKNSGPDVGCPLTAQPQIPSWCFSCFKPHEYELLRDSRACGRQNV